MAEILTAEEIDEIREQNFDALLQARENECFPGMLQGEQLQIQRLLTTIEALQAHNKRLVEALEPFGNWYDRNAAGEEESLLEGLEVEDLKRVKQALYILPADVAVH